MHELAEDTEFSSVYEVRTVAMHVDGKGWYHFATLVKPGTQPSKSEVISIDNVRLIRHTFDSVLVRSSDQLREQLSSWRMTLGAPSGYQFHQAVHSVRHVTDKKWFNGPYWMLDCREDTKLAGEYDLPKGLMFSEQDQMFAESAPELAEKWLGVQHLSSQNSTADTYRIAIPDGRLWISSMSLEARNLKIQLAGTHDPLGSVCVVRSHGQFGDEHQLVHKVRSREIALELESAPKRLRVWIVAGTEELDKYREDEVSWSSIGPVINVPRAQADEPFADLTGALLSGEDITTEFKEWIPISPLESKEYELAKTVVAFSNRQGGRLFIGVTDDGQPLGVDKALRQHYAKAANGDLTIMQEKYVSDLRKMVSEGIDPAASLSFDWIKISNRNVLRITVPMPAAAVYSIVGTGEVYTRAGGTSRKVRHADIFALQRRLSSSE